MLIALAHETKLTPVHYDDLDIPHFRLAGKWGQTVYVHNNLHRHFDGSNAILFIMPPFEKRRAYCFAHASRYVGRSVCRYPLTLCN